MNECATWHKGKAEELCAEKINVTNYLIILLGNPVDTTT